MNVRKQIEAQAKDTVVYSEAKNKKSFMTGVSVAISKAEEHYGAEVKQLKSQIEQYKSYCEIYLNDLKTLSTIINRYSDNG